MDNKIIVKYHAKKAKPIAQAHPGEWIDLRAAEDVFMEEGTSTIIPLGVSIKVPTGYEAILAPRSSTFRKFGIIQTNGVGVIDETYCGEEDIWGMPVYATRYTEIPAGERIAQFRIQPIQGSIIIEEVERISDKSRGGFGSTDI